MIADLGQHCRRAFDALLAVALAPECAACHTILASSLDGPICAACWSATLPLTPPLCDACGDPIPSWRTYSRDAGLCPRCRRRPRWIDRGRAAGEYTGALKEIIHAFKYSDRRSVATGLAHRMHAAATDLLLDADFVVPVPLHPRRRRARGFNQAEDLARQLGPPVCDALQRIRPTTSQTGLSAAKRHRNVRGAFRVRRDPLWVRAVRPLAGSALRLCELKFAPSTFLIKNARIVLVDDVSTTGATLEACAKVLKEAGAREVRALTAARVVGRPR